MWKPKSLRSRLLLMLGCLVLITIGGGLASIWYTYEMDKFFNSVFEDELPALRAAEELRNSLIMQKGYVTYYFQDANPKWLEQLGEYDRRFEIWLKKARQWADNEKERNILNDIESQYIRYSLARDNVVNLYREGRKEEGFKVHQKVREQFFFIMDLCRLFQSAHEESTATVRRDNRQRAKTVKESAIVALMLAVLFGGVLAYTLIRQVLGPIRQLAFETEASKDQGNADNEIKALGHRFESLMKDVDQTRLKLEWSKEHLLQAEKWALVGKLAAGVAHSVRNPLTSVKMRLFSLERSLQLSPSQKDDFEVISEEIRHIDTIVNNFLEFSRPPKLKMRMASPSDAVDLAVQLLRHRLESYNVRVEVQRTERLPEIELDPDQLKEVLVNLMVNACEAMVDGGVITIQEEMGVSDNNLQVVVVRMSDNGPGIPEAIQGKMFQPFFSTKEEGTGLGLSIATRIVEEHGGWFDLKSREGEGATFSITLPVGEAKTWAQSSS